MPKFIYHPTKRIGVLHDEKLDELIEYYNKPDIAKTLREVVVNHFEIIQELKKVKKQNKKLEYCNEVLINKIKHC